jgi:hypothetical protein
VPAAPTPEAAIEKYASYGVSSSTVEWPQALFSAGIAVLMTIVLIVFTPFGLGTLPSGFLCVVLYRRRRPAAHLTVGMGARLGALTGVLSFGVLAAILALWTAFRSGKEIHDAILSRIQQYSAQSSYPSVQQAMDLLNTPEGFTFFMIFSLVMALIAFTIFSSLGGAIGAFLLHRKERL